MNVDTSRIDTNKLAKTVRVQLAKAMDKLMGFDHPILSRDVSKIKSHSSGAWYTVRLGKQHRALFTIEGDTVVILDIRNRKDTY